MSNKKQSMSKQISLVRIRFFVVLLNIQVNGDDHVRALILFQYVTSTVLLNRTNQVYNIWCVWLA